MEHNSELFKYQFASGELELGGLPALKQKVALETVMIEDQKWENRFEFVSAKNLDFKHEYLWIPIPDGVVAVFKFGYERKTKADKSHWTPRKRKDFPHCVVVVSLRPSSPYISVSGYDKAFKNADEVASLLCNGLNNSFKGRGISIRISPCDKHDSEARHWMEYMLKVLKKAQKHKDSTIRELENYERMKRGQIPASFRSCIKDSEKADKIIALIHKYMKGKIEPRDILMPIVAAMKAKVIRRPTWPEASTEFHLRDSLQSSFHRLTSAGCRTYRTTDLDDMVKDFLAL